MPYWAVPPYGACTDATAYTLLSVDDSDLPALAALTGMKASNPQLRVLLSVGGWNFPSHFFSKMASSAASRATFAASVASWLASTGADGVSLDWESPCSAPRTAEVEIACADFRVVADAGGSCPQDTYNVALLVQDLRKALGPGKIVSLATQAGKLLEQDMNVSVLAEYADWLDLMTYDYSVSDIPNAGPMAPNAPLYTPSDQSIAQMSINYTVMNYLAAGVPASKIRGEAAAAAHALMRPPPNSAAQRAGGSSLRRCAALTMRSPPLSLRNLHARAPPTPSSSRTRSRRPALRAFVVSLLIEENPSLAGL